MNMPSVREAIIANKAQIPEEQDEPHFAWAPEVGRV